MYQRNRARVLFIALVASAIVLVTLDVRDVGRDDAEGVVASARSLATRALRPFQSGVSAIVDGLGRTVDGVGDLRDVRRRNAELEAEVAELSERRRSVADLERENTELRSLLGLRDRLELDTVAARTVGLSPSTFEWLITIDVGSEHGVERGMPVIDGVGLVGRVYQVTPRASRVLLLIDPTFSVVARGANDGVIGLLGGRGGDPLLFRPLDPRGVLAVGSELVTASYDGGRFPSGIPIGVVSEIGPEDSRLSRDLRVRPYVDFSRLNHVLVVLTRPVDPVPDLEGTSEVPFVRPPGAPGLFPPVDPGEDGPGTGDGATP